MRALRTMLIVLVPVACLGACTTLSAEDRALIASANQNAQQAKDMAQQALTASQAAQASANQAASDARAANEKADRMYQRSLRKTSR